MINKTLITIIIGMFLVGIVSAGALDLKPIDSKDQIDFKTEIYLVKDDGVYNDKDLKVKTEEEAEIWIDRKVGNTYYVDSLVKEPTNIKLELFYDIQPDTITFISHSRTTKIIYTYNDWVWEDKINCGEENYCGGYATLEVNGLEYALGSNTFTSAISGATWQNDGILITLINAVDYTINTGTGLFTIVNNNTIWEGLNASWTYTTNYGENSVNSLTTNFTKGIDNISSKIPVVFTIAIIVVILGILVLLIGAWKKMRIGGGSI